MNCPKCGSYQVRVLETMPSYGGKVYRRRYCSSCNSRFRTVEHMLPDDEQSQKDYRESATLKSPLPRHRRK